MNLASVADGNIVTGLVLGHSFRLVSWRFLNTVPVTTGSKATTLNVEIDTVNATGGAIALTSANQTPIGAIVEQGTAFSAGNTGTPTSVIDIEAASTTAFAEGAGAIILTIENLD